jgi:putative transposase
VRKALVLAYGVHESGDREGSHSTSASRAFWRSFLRSLVARGLAGVQLVVSDAHAGLKKAIAKVLGCPGSAAASTSSARRSATPAASSSRCSPALLRPIFNADSGAAARELVGDPLERLRTPLPKLAGLLEEAEEDLLASTVSPATTGPSCSTNPLERVNREIGRRTDVVGVFTNDRSLIRLAASVVIEQNDEWLVGRRYLSAHSLEPLLAHGNPDQEQEQPSKKVLALTTARAADDADELHHVLGLDSRQALREDAA